MTSLVEALRSGRVHALWALDAIGDPSARRAIRSAMGHADAAVRLQAARSTGIRRDREALLALAMALRDPDASVRREAAIALGRLGDVKAGPPLYAALGDTDIFAAWSIRHSIRALGAWDLDALSAALVDPKRREDALKLADESWSVPAVQALTASLAASEDPSWQVRVVAALAGLYRRYPDWSGQWFGTNPLAGVRPRKTVDWNPEGMNAVLVGLVKGLHDGDPMVRRRAIVGLIDVGRLAVPLLRVELDRESDPINLAAIVQALGSLGDLKALPALSQLLQDPARPIEARIAALEALSGLNSPQALNARLMLAYDSKAPEALVAKALPGLGRGRILPANDLAGFLDHKSATVRAAALAAFPIGKPLPIEVREAFLARLEDPSPEVRKAAIEGVAAHKLREAIPRLVRLSADEAHRVEATLALAELPDPRALSVYVAALSDRDPSTRKAGESALVAIRDPVVNDLESMARQGKFVGPSALAVERVLSRFRPVIAWRVIGPFPRTTGPHFEDSKAIDFARKQVGAEGRTIAWQARQADPSTARVVIDDLKGGADDRSGFGYDVNGSPDLAAFAYTELDSDRDRTALMLVGSSGPILISVNDQPVLNVDSFGGRPYASDSDLARFPLKKGMNRILVRTRQGIGAWCFGLQVSEASTTEIAGQTVSAGLEGLRAFAFSHSGDPRNGEAIFFDANGVGCVKCHAVGGKGTANIGPDLTGLAARYDKAEVVRSVLEPSDRIAIGYQPVVVAKADGTVLAGLLRDETDAHLDLVDAEGSAVPGRQVRDRPATGRRGLDDAGRARRFPLAGRVRRPDLLPDDAEGREIERLGLEWRAFLFVGQGLPCRSSRAGRASPALRRGNRSGLIRSHPDPPPFDEPPVVLGCVDPHAPFLDDPEGDRVAGLEDPELFELLGRFQWGRGEFGQAEQEVTTVGVEAEMQERGGRVRGEVGQAVAVVGDRAPGEVESPSTPRGHDLDARRVAVDGLVADRRGEGRHRRLGVGFEQGDDEVQGLAGEFRLVPLEVDDQVGFRHPRDHLGHAVGPGRVVVAGEGDLAAEPLDRAGDPLVVGGDDDPVESPGPPGGLDDVLDQRSACVGKEGFAGQSG